MPNFVQISLYRGLLSKWVVLHFIREANMQSSHWNIHTATTKNQRRQRSRATVL